MYRFPVTVGSAPPILTVMDNDETNRFPKIR
jgi:hypothetical protein